jgi:type IV fimbrial biogenesis protein FimT
MLPVETSRNRTTALHSCRGFGLIELVVAVAIVAILAAAALPSFRELGRRMTVSTTTNDLVGALNTARAEAAKRGSWVAVIGVGNDWSAGWRVEADVGNAPTPPDQVFGGASDVVMQTYGTLGTGYSVRTLVSGGNDAQVVFGPAGNLVDSATRADINVCRPDGQAAQSRWIHISGSGEISSQRNTAQANDLAPSC